jgi:peptidoglycan-associated lipoprotein
LKQRDRILAPLALLISLIVVAGCSKKAPVAPPAAEEAPTVVGSSIQTPTAQITATPTVVSAGDQVVLSWRTTDATTVSIDGIGDVPTSGVKTVTPTESTSYHLVARGAGGTADATTRVTLNAPPVVVVQSTTISTEEEFKGAVKDAFFDYDTYDIRGDAQAVLSADASWLAAHPDIKVVIGGYCDERGSNEYNLALGQNRADAAKNALITAGIAATRVRVISYGKEKPFCSESTEECWQQNRRAGFTLDR